MTLKTANQYEESLRKMNLKVYLPGELVKNPVDHPIIRPSMNSVKMTYALAQDTQHEDIMTAKSHLSGEKINRFCHLHQSTEDLIKKVKIQRLLGQKTASCFQMCVGMDAINKEDADYAVSFVAPADAEGIYYIYGRQSCDTRKLEGCEIDVGNRQFGGHEAVMVFDNLFVPWENVFMCGEYDFSGALVERFAGYHRQSYGGCKVGVGDVLIGAAALAADYNGAAKASLVKDKLIEMTHLNETLFSCGIACSAQGHKTASGTYLIDLLLANVCKQNVTRFPYEIARLAEDIAGGLMVTMASEKDLRHLEIGKIVEKYFKGIASVSTENRCRISRLVENITLGTGRCRLPHGIHARRRLSAGSTNYDFSSGKY